MFRFDLSFFETSALAQQSSNFTAFSSAAISLILFLINCSWWKTFKNIDGLGSNWRHFLLSQSAIKTTALVTFQRHVLQIFHVHKTRVIQIVFVNIFILWIIGVIVNGGLLVLNLLDGLEREHTVLIVVVFGRSFETRWLIHKDQFLSRQLMSFCTLFSFWLTLHVKL